MARPTPMKWLLAGLSSACMFLTLPSGAFACTCAAQSESEAARAVLRSADLSFIGVLKSVRKLSEPPPPGGSAPPGMGFFRYRVIRAYGGDPGEFVRVRAQLAASACGLPRRTGGKIAMGAYRSRRDGALESGACSVVSPPALRRAARDDSVEPQRQGLRPRPLPTTEPVGVVGQTLARLDPLTLEPRRPHRRLGEYHDGWSLSPERSRVALGMGSPGQPTCGAGLCLIDLASMRIVGDIDAPVAAEAVGWVSSRRIAAVLQSGQVLVFDPRTEETLRQRSFPSSVYGPPTALSSGTFVTLLGGGRLNGPATLVAVDRAGRIRAAELPRLRVGGVPARLDRAGLAVDRLGHRAFVFAAGAPAAEVDLRTMRVRYHRLRDGSAAAPAPNRSFRDQQCAVWLGGGQVAVAGDGVQLVDTGTWAATTLSRQATAVRFSAGRLLAYRGRFSEPRRQGVGLRVYTRSGRLLARRFGTQLLDVQVAGRYAYVLGRQVRIVDPRSGKLVHRARDVTRRFTVVMDGLAGSLACSGFV